MKKKTFLQLDRRFDQASVLGSRTLCPRGLVGWTWWKKKAKAVITEMCKPGCDQYGKTLDNTIHMRA